MQNKKNAFTFLEVIFVLVIIGILAIIGIPSYRGYVKRGIATEGRNVLSDISSGQQSYRYRTGKYYETTSTESMSPQLGVDFSRNKYFTSYEVTADNTNNTFTAITTYKGKSLTLTGGLNKKPTIVDEFTNEID